MTKEVKLDGVGALPLPAAPKLVKKKYTITGDGAQAAAVQLKAQLALQKGVVRPGPGTPKPETTAGKQALQAQSLVKQAVAKNTTTGVQATSEVGAMLDAKTATGQVRLQKITLPAAQFGKPDPKLLQSAAGKMGTGPQVAASLQDAGTVYELIGQLQQQVGEVGFLNDYQLMVLLIAVNASQQKDNRSIRNSANNTQIATAMLHEAQTKIDNSAAKFDAFLGALDSIMKFNETTQSMGPQGAKLGADLKEGLARAKAEHAQTEVERSTRELTAATAPVEALGQIPPAMAAAITGTPTTTPLPEGATARTPEQLLQAESAAKADLAGPKLAPVNAARLAAAHQGVAKARSDLVADAALHSKDPPPAGATETPRTRIQRIVSEEEGELAQARPENGPEAMALRAQLGTYYLVLADVTQPAGGPDATQAKNAAESHFKAIQTATGSPATEARVRADAATFRVGCKTLPADQLTEARKPLTDLSQSLVTEHHTLVIARDAAVAQLRQRSFEAAQTRLSIDGTHPLPPAGVQAAAAAHANAEATHFGSPLRSQLDTATEELANLRATHAPQAQIDAKATQVQDLAGARGREIRAVDAHAARLYGSDEIKPGGMVHTPGLIENVSAMTYSGDISTADAARAYQGLSAATAQYGATMSTSTDPAARAQAELAMSRAEAGVSRPFEEARFKQNDRMAVWPDHVQTLTGLDAAEEAQITAQATLDREVGIRERLGGATPPPTKAQIDAQQAKVNAASSDLSAATGRVTTLQTQSSFEMRAGKEAPTAEEIASTHRLIGIPAPAAPALPPGGSPVPLATTPPASSILGVAAQQAALQARMQANGDAQTANKKALAAQKADPVLAAKPTDPALLETQKRLAVEGQSLGKESQALVMQSQSLSAQLRQVTAGQERRSQNWTNPPPAATLSPFAAGTPRTWDGYTHAIDAADAAVPPLYGQPFQSPNSLSDPLTNELALRAYYDAIPAQPHALKQSFADARAAALVAPAQPADSNTPEGAFALAARAIDLHHALDPALNQGQQTFGEQWTPAAQTTFAAAHLELDAAATASALQTSPNPDGTPGAPERPTVADTEGTDPAGAARRAAATRYLAAHDACSKAADNGQATAKAPSQTLPPPTAKGSIADRFVLGPLTLISQGINLSGIAQVSIRLRRGMEQIRDEAQRKAEQVAGAARSNLLHATDGASGRWRGTLDVIRKLVEASAKGR